MDIKRFDIVKLKTIENVKWMSGPSGRPATPIGNWSVIGNIKTSLLLSKNNTIIKVPVNDIVKIADYDINKIGRKRV